MSDTLYIQTDKNIKVTKERVRLGEIAKLSCSNASVLNRNLVLPVATFPQKQFGRYVISIMDIIQKSKKKKKT